MPGPQHAQPAANRRPGTSPHQPGHRSPGHSPAHGFGAGGALQPTLQAISAPYNFVPLANWVHIPEWGRQVSHDLPWREGYSGEIVYTLTAHTPLLVGGTQTKADKKASQPGHVKPFRLPDGRYAIPGSSLKGMLRAVLEIAGFGRMRFVDDQRLSVRDLTPAAREIYGSKMTDTIGKNTFKPKVHAGWLSFESGTELDSRWVIQPCEFSRIEHDDIAAYIGVSEWKSVPGESDPKPFTDGKAREARNASCVLEWKYETWQNAKGSLKISMEIEPTKNHQHGADGKEKFLVYSRAKFLQGSANANPTAKQGQIVFTGQPGKRIRGRSGKKHMEFFFHSPSESKKVVPDRVINDFLHIHAESTEWAYLNKLFGKKSIPIFYLSDGNGTIRSLGLAMMYRLPYEFSIRDMIAHSSPDHLDAPGLEKGYDLADLLFGAINDGDEDKQRGTAQFDALRGRVYFESAVTDQKITVQPTSPTILNGPKPTFLPNYVTQPGAFLPDWRLSGNSPTYASYVASGSNRAPTIRGFKRYPVRNGSSIQRLTPDQVNNAGVQTVLHPLPEKTQFSGRIVFNNLRAEELGALLWAITWGENPNLRHALGMAKPFGFGQVSLTIDETASHATPNDPEQKTIKLGATERVSFVERFAQHMERVVQPQAQKNASSAGNASWLQTPQMLNLLAMADPTAAKKWTQSGRRLEHMRLDEENEFVQAKKSSLVLADYAVVTGYLDPANYKPARGQIPTRAPASTAPAPSAKPQAAPVAQTMETVGPSTLRLDKGKQTLSLSGKTPKGVNITAITRNPAETKKLLEAFPETLIEKLKKKGELPGVRATVQAQGNSYLLVALLPQNG